MKIIKNHGFFTESKPSRAERLAYLLSVWLQVFQNSISCGSDLGCIKHNSCEFIFVQSEIADLPGESDRPVESIDLFSEVIVLQQHRKDRSDPHLFTMKSLARREIVVY